MVLTLDEVRARYGLPGDSEVTEALDQGETLPALLYVAPEVYQLEQQKIFSRSWQYACHESRVKEPGDYAVARAGDTPIVVTCADDGELRGFVNVCRHRLHAVAPENGRGQVMQCPYHGWTYGMDGRLVSAPRSRREPGFDCSAISLEPVSVARWDQWVFVNPDPEAPSLDSVVQDIRPFTDELNADLRGYEFQVRYEYPMECNWKIWAENAVECYHCPTLHRSSFGRTYDTRPDRYLLGSFEDTITNAGPIKWLPDGVDPESLKGFRFAYLWPTSFFALDDYVGFVGAIMPLAPERCLAFVDMYSKPGADPSVVADWLKMWDQTLIEDQAATDNQQVGYRSGRVPRGRLMLDSEHPLQAFMRRTWKALVS